VNKIFSNPPQMPHQIIEEIPVKAGPKPQLETHTTQDMSEEPSDDQGYLKAKRRFPRLSVNTYCMNSCFFADSRIQESLPSKDKVREYLDKYNWSLYECVYKGIQKADRKQKLHELIEKGPADEGAIRFVVHYLGNYLLSISSAAARQAFPFTDLYEEAIRPLLEKYPELVRRATIQIATTLIDNISNELEDKDHMLLLSNFNSLECPKVRGLIDNPELSRLLPADQLEVARKTLEEATELYNSDPDLYDYLTAAYDTLNMLD
jgi:hypothetical protein